MLKGFWVEEMVKLWFEEEEGGFAEGTISQLKAALEPAGSAE